MSFSRYAIYAAPEGALWEAGSHWLGWDAVHAAALPQPDIAGLPRPAPDITSAPRRYGFHATLKAPFRLADGVTEDDLAWAAEALALRLVPASILGLRLAVVGGFAALVSEGGEEAVSGLAARVVEALDPMRAPLTEADIARRNPDRLTPRQRELLDRWGYPLVMEEFRFHMTLTDKLPPDERVAAAAALALWFAPHLPRPYVIDSLCLFAEDAEGRFHLRGRYPLGG